MTDMTGRQAAREPTVGAPDVTPGVQSFLDELAAAGEPPVYQLSPADAHEVLRAGQAVEVARPAADIQDRTVPGGPDGEVSVRIVRPEGAAGTLPALMYLTRWRLGPRGQGHPRPPGARDRRGHDAGFDTPSYQRFAGLPWLTRKAMTWFWDAYAPDVSVRSEPTASPLRARLEELRGLPPTLLITAENDPLRDEGEAYAHRLMQAGVSVSASRYLGTIHDFLMLNPIAATTPTRAALAQVVEVVGRSVRRVN